MKLCLGLIWSLIFSFQLIAKVSCNSNSSCVPLPGKPCIVEECTGQRSVSVQIDELPYVINVPNDTCENASSVGVTQLPHNNLLNIDSIPFSGSYNYKVCETKTKNYEGPKILKVVSPTRWSFPADGTNVKVKVGILATNATKCTWCGANVPCNGGTTEFNNSTDAQGSISKHCVCEATASDGITTVKKIGWGNYKCASGYNVDAYFGGLGTKYGTKKGCSSERIYCGKTVCKTHKWSSSDHAARGGYKRIGCAKIKQKCGPRGCRGNNWSCTNTLSCGAGETIKITRIRCENGKRAGPRYNASKSRAEIDCYVDGRNPDNFHTFTCCSNN